MQVYQEISYSSNLYITQFFIGFAPDIKSQPYYLLICKLTLPLNFRVNLHVVLMFVFVYVFVLPATNSCSHRSLYCLHQNENNCYHYQKKTFMFYLWVLYIRQMSSSLFHIQCSIMLQQQSVEQKTTTCCTTKLNNIKSKYTGRVKPTL